MSQNTDIATLPQTRAERRAAKRAAQEARRVTGRKPRFWRVRSVLIWVLVVQLLIAGFLMGRDLFAALPHIAWPSTQPRFDTPVIPGDQVRRFQQDLPLAPTREGNPERPFRSTGEMPNRLSFRIENRVLILTGQIAIGDAARYTRFLEDAKRTIEMVRLNSPGGSVPDALSIGRAIRQAGLTTVMGAVDICLSACPYILAGGKTRDIHSDAQVGVHQHYFGANSALPAFLAVETIQRGQGEVMSYLTDMGIDIEVMKHALLTPPDEIYVLLPDQLEKYRFTSASE